MSTTVSMQDRIVPAGERLECLWNDGCVLTEGVAAGIGLYRIRLNRRGFQLPRKSRA